MEEREILSKKLESKTLKALGTFLIFFSLVVLFSIIYTPGAEGKIINGIAGSLLLGIGTFMFHRGRIISKVFK